MRWTILLQCDDDNGERQTAEVLTLERDARPPPSSLGLLHREGKALLLRLQRLIVRQQAQAFCRRLRPCPACGAGRAIKDYRSRTLHTLFGTVTMRLRRFHRCACEPIGSGRVLRYVWPATDLLPSVNTPELIAMHAALGARMPYREAAFLLSTLLPCERPWRHTTVRNHLLQVGARIDFEGPGRAVETALDAVDWASVAVDGTYVRGLRHCPRK